MLYNGGMDLRELAAILAKGRNGLPKAEIARRVGISESFVAMVEGAQRRPSKVVIEKWAQVLGWTDPRYLSRLLALAGHGSGSGARATELSGAPLDEDSLTFPEAHTAAPNALRMTVEREELTREFLGLMDLGLTSPERWELLQALLPPFFEWFKFRLGSGKALEP